MRNCGALPRRRDFSPMLIKETALPEAGFSVSFPKFVTAVYPCHLPLIVRN
jgi:hypothetical protein